MERTQPEGLSIEAGQRNGKGTVTLTARLAGVTVAVEAVNLTKPKARADFAAAVCHKRPGIDGAEVERCLLQLADAEAQRLAEDEARRLEQHTTDAPSIASAAELLAKTPEATKEEASAMLGDPILMRRVIDDVAAIGVAGEKELSGTVYLVGVSRLLPAPVAAIVQGHTSSGKSYVVEHVARLFPGEAVLMATQLTPQALYYMPARSLRHRFVIVGERSRLDADETAEATRALREMLSAGRLSKALPVKVGDRMQTELIEQEGPIAYIETTSQTTIFEEDLNRCLLLATDDRREQTRRVVQRVAEQFSGSGGTADAQRIIAKHHAAQRMLQQRPVIVPYAERLGQLFASDRVEARRAFPRLLAMIQAVALLYQRQRQPDAAGNIVATEEDYQLARHLLARPFARQLGGGASDSAIRFAERLEDLPRGAEFTTSDAHALVKDEFTRRAVTGWLVELVDAGLVEQTEPHKGCKPARWKWTGQTPDQAAVGRGVMPEPEELFGDWTFRHSDKR